MSESHLSFTRQMICCQVLRRKAYAALSPADCYSWPAVTRGCNTIVISHNADQPLSYLTPLLTHILLNSIFSSLTSRTGVSTSAQPLKLDSSLFTINIVPHTCLSRLLPVIYVLLLPSAVAIFSMLMFVCSP